MHKIMFVCHGNICRSPMAEFVFKDIVKKHGKQNDYVIESSATSREELGNPVHRGTVRKLAQFGISCAGKYARQLQKSDYDKFDMFIGMDSYNLVNMMRIFGSDPDKKIHSMMSFAGSNEDVADPWYTGDFDKTYEDIKLACDALFELLDKEK